MLSNDNNDNNHQSKKDLKNSDFCSLFRILGFGSKDNFSVSANNLNGLVTWISGPYLIFYDPEIDKQVSFLKNVNNKIISCLTFSKDGKYLATGEGNCKNGQICIYDIEYNNQTHIETHKLKCSFKNHKYGIEKICFVKEDKYIISIGNKEDKLINIFSINDQGIVFNSKYNRPIIGFDICDNFMVLTGEQFIKIYKFKSLFETYESNGESTELIGKNLMDKKHVDLYKLKEHTFVCASIYIDKNDEKKTKIYFMTLQCYLVEMNSNSLTLSRWLFLKGTLGLTLCVFDNKIACGCSDGILRIFKAETLEFVANMHHPPPLGKANIEANSSKSNPPIEKNEKFPDTSIIWYSSYHKKLIVSYSNNFLFFWDLDKSNIYRSNIFHTGSINSIDYAISPEENLLRMVSCSDDKTVIYWNLKLDEFIENKINIKNKHLVYSKYIRHIFYLSKNKNYQNFKITKEKFLNQQNGNNSNINEINENIEEDEINSATAIKISPDKKFMAVGDNLGNINIFDLETFENKQTIPLFDDAINTIDMIEDKETKKSFMAIGGNVNILSVIDITNSLEKDKDFYNKNNTNSIFETTNSSIISVLFCIDKNNILKLVTAEADSTIIFYIVKKTTLQTFQKFKENDLQTYCLCYCPFINKIISGHNGQIKIWKTSSCIVHKHFQVSKGDKNLDNFRIAVDTTGAMFATSNNDKIIRIRALHNGTLLAKIPIAESISSLSFAIDNKYLIATSVEGYVYFLKISDEYVNKLKTENSLIVSTENSNIMMNKLKLLQKLMENDNNLSKNEQVKYLIDKMKNSEEFTIDDVKLLDSYYKDNKHKSKERKISDDKDINKIENNNKEKKKEESFKLNEDKPNDNDDEENKNNDECKFEGPLTKSHIFEIGLKEKKSITNQDIKKNSLRVSLADAYLKNNNNNMKSNNDINKFELAKDLNNINNINDNSLNDNNINNNRNPSEPKMIKISKIPLNGIVFNNNNNDKEKNNNQNIKNEDKGDIKDIRKNNDNSNKEVEKKLSDILKSDDIINDKIKDAIKPQVSKIDKKEEENKNKFQEINSLQKLINEANNKVSKAEEKIKTSDLNISNLTNNNNNNMNKENIKNDTEENDEKIYNNHNNKNNKNDQAKYSSLLNNFADYNPYNTNINKLDDEQPIEEDIIGADEGENEEKKESPINGKSNKNSNKFISNIVKNSQADVSESFYKNLIVTQSNFAFKPKNKKSNFNEISISDAESLCFCFNDADKNKRKIQNINKNIEINKKINNFCIKGKSESAKDKLINSIKNFNVNKCNYNESKEIEKELENLLDKIRIKNGNQAKDPTMEKMLEKYSVLLLDRIDKLSNK